MRSTMETLVARLRRMIGDAPGPETTWTDDELQDVLDEHRRDVYNELLQPMASYTSAGAGPNYLEHQACAGQWEDSPTIQNASRVTVTPDSSDNLAGLYSFTTEPSYPLYISGSRFDLNGAAADVLEQWASRVVLDFDFSPGSGMFFRSQKQRALLNLAERFRRKAWPTTAALVRTDVDPDPGGTYLATLRG